MSYASQETSTQDGQPLELYHFSQVSGTEKFTFTSGQINVEHDGDIYTPAPIARSSPKIGVNTSSGNITLTFPRDHEYVQRYIQGQPPLPETCTIYRGHSTDGATPEMITFFSGDVNGVVFEGNEAKVTLATVSARMQREVPKRSFSWSCNHVLYDGLCQIGKESYRSDVRVVSISTDGLTVFIEHDPAWGGTSAADRVAGDATYFAGGLVKFSSPIGTYSRTIMAYDSGTGSITLSLPLETLTVSGIMSLYAGCNHAAQTCRDKFNNIRNYGGFPFVPTSNPFSDGIVNDYKE